MSSNGKPLRVVLCTMVLDESKTIVEWVVFHLQQGFTQIWVYTDEQGDEPGSTYRTLFRYFDGIMHPWTGRPVVVVKRVPADLPRSSYTIDETDFNQRLIDERRQKAVLNSCYKEASTDGVDWIGAHDVDEFHFSPTFNRIDSYLHSIPDHFITFALHQFRFGNNGYQRTRGWPELIVETRRNRSASAANGEDKLLNKLKRTTYHEACKRRKAGWNFCHTDGTLATNESINHGRHMTMTVQRGDTKSYTRGGYDCEMSPHYARCLYDGIEEKGAFVAPLSMIVGNHYYYRSKEGAELKAKLWHKTDPVDVFEYGAENFFNEVRDDSIHRYVPRLKKALRMVHARAGAILRQCFDNNVTMAMDFYSLPVYMEGLGFVTS